MENTKRRGRQTPTIGVTLPYTSTRGREAIELYNSCGRTAQEWQENLIYDMMAVDGDGIWVHSRYGYSLPRQNGKNEVVAMREVWGLINGERILHTAHRTATSKAAWDRAVAILEGMGTHEVDGEHPNGYKVQRARGREEIVLDDNLGGGHLYFRSRTTTGGLGETFDLLVIDEAQEYQDDQESALKYTIVSSDNPQTIYLGTPPTPYSSGTKFVEYRKRVICGELKHAAWAEWSVDEMTDINDVDAWYETNPSLGYKLTERAIEDEIGDDKVDFNIQRLGLWIKYNQKSAISQTEWDALRVDKLPTFTGALSVGVKFAKDGASVSMSVAVKTTDERIFIETIGCRSMRDGVGWIAQFAKKVGTNANKIIVDGASGVEMLTQEFKDMKIKPPYIPTVREIIDSNAVFEQAIFNKTLAHMAQPSLQQIATNCEKRPIGSSGGFGWKAIHIGHDISILDSAALAVWGVERMKPAHKQKISY